MSVPSLYVTSREYLVELFSFLKSNQWLYNYHNTDVLVNKVFNNFPEVWIKYFKSLSCKDIYQLNLLNSDCPVSLKSLITQIKSLQPEYSIKIEPIEYNFLHNCGLSAKKLHEIKHFSPLINEICTKNKTNLIIDIGSGLGYLSHLLHALYGYSVEGIEGDAEKVQLAYKNQSKFYPAASETVTFLHHFITHDSDQFLRGLLVDRLKGAEKACIIGLHACADLSITILELFAKLDCLNSLIIMPCCYHRIKLDRVEENREYFQHFPVSRLYKELFEEFDGFTFVKRPLLRLACQQSVSNFVRMSEKEHEVHAKNVLHRAILQDVAGEMGFEVRRLKRKSGQKTAVDSNNCEDDFAVYMKNIQFSHILERNDGTASVKLEISDDTFTKRMWKKWEENNGDCYLVEVLTGLQAAIQSVCENVVLLDRVEMLKERGLDCIVEKVTDESVSPRCFALVTCR